MSKTTTNYQKPIKKQSVDEKGLNERLKNIDDTLLELKESIYFNQK